MFRSNHLNYINETCHIRNISKHSDQKPKYGIGPPVARATGRQIENRISESAYDDGLFSSVIIGDVARDRTSEEKS